MTKPTLGNPQNTIEILQKYDFSFQKKFGQNFLIDTHVLDKIISSAEITKDDFVLEIGPGIGTMTQYLACAARQVVAVEIDKALIPILEDTLQAYDNVTVINDDVLKVDIPKLAKEYNDNKPIKVVANLPYYITTPIMMHILESDLAVDEMVVMMQREVADRISAKPGTKAYGSLSIAVQYYMEASTAFIVPKTVFVPQPNVDSAILRLVRRETPAVEVTNEAEFFKLTKAAFNMRRKTLWNNLLSSYGKDELTKTWLETSLEQAEIDPKRRGETLSLEEFARLSNALEANKKN